MGLHHLSKDQISRLCRGLDEQVSVFRERPLEGAYPYLSLDAKVERAREPGGMRHKALVIAYGVHESGRRELIDLDVGEAETESALAGVPAGLRRRSAPVGGHDCRPAHNTPGSYSSYEVSSGTRPPNRL